MKKIHTGLAIAALAAFAAAPTMAQSHIQSSGGATVTSGTGVVVTPGAPTVVVTPGAAVVPQANLLPGGQVTTIGTTTVSGAGPAPNSATTTTVTRYWVNVPAGAENDPQFQRWQRLK